MLRMTDFSHFSAPQPRRQSPRIPGPFKGRLVGDISVPVQARDLSTGGCFVDADEQVLVSASMRLHIELPGEEWISAEVETVYRLGTQGVALKFVDLDDGTRQRILREIERALSQTGQ